tara:strand:+ start:431 stop:805 length:375 start_codon:yes stop_codon:yes gene_type:complete
MGTTQKILVVEDNDFVRMQICRFLTDEGYEVVEATDGSAALGLINENISLAIVDVRMEPVDGFEFVRKIRSEDNKTPVFLVTGDDNPDLLSEASRLGIGAVLKKPVQKDRLIKMVARILSMVRV